jgi:hypothetical protein
VDTVRRDALELSKLLTASKEVQWESSPRPKTFEEIASLKGAHADPTSEVALDERRLKVREAVRAADNALIAVAHSLAIAHSRLAVALADWEGDEGV